MNAEDATKLTLAAREAQKKAQAIYDKQEADHIAVKKAAASESMGDWFDTYWSLEIAKLAALGENDITITIDKGSYRTLYIREFLFNRGFTVINSGFVKPETDHESGQEFGNYHWYVVSWGLFKKI